MTELRIGYGVYNVLQQYWTGQGDPLYAVLSRRGPSVDWVVVDNVSGEEMDALMDAAQAAAEDEENTESERRAAQNFYAHLGDLADGDDRVENPDKDIVYVVTAGNDWESFDVIGVYRDIDRAHEVSEAELIPRVNSAGPLAWSDVTGVELDDYEEDL